MKYLSLVFGTLVLLAAGVGFFLMFSSGSVSIPNKSEPPNGPSSKESGAFSIPEGFSSFSVFADGVPNARVMTFDPRGTLLVSSLSGGKIFALPDKDGDFLADEVAVVAENLNLPHGIAFRCSNPDTPYQCDLYVAEHDKLSVFEYDAETRQVENKRVLLDLPSGSLGMHKTRSLLFLPYPHEDTLLISIGSSCNVCIEDDSRRASILAYNIQTKEARHFATGLRNAVFMTLHPVTGEVWATEMGRDWLGDDLPPDEVNIIKEGAWYGWPWFYGKNIEDMTFSPNSRPSFAKMPESSTVDLQAHSAPLGLAFIPEAGWPEESWFDLLVAYHGSWNREEPTGYKIVRIQFDKDGAYTGTEDFITGWLGADGKTVGRPADIIALPGGTVFISDDQAGRIYRLSR